MKKNLTVLRSVLFFVCVSLAALYYLSGCGTAPIREELVPVCALNGSSYYSLISLCDSKGIAWQYDTITRTATLTKGNHRASLIVGDNLVLVDGRAVMLSAPADLYQGMVVVPASFKTQVTDVLFVDAASVTQRQAPSQRLKKVVIDAGHGGHDPGAIGKSGLKEKEVNLDIAKRLANILRSEGINVILTRSSDIFIPLANRASIANNARVDLFISVHSNANRVRSLKGFEAYYVAPTVSDTQRASAAAKGVGPNVDRNCFADDSANLKAIVWDMVYTDARAESVELANSISDSMDDNTNSNILGIKQARFQVLREVKMPAVLIEVGFVSNAEEEQLLRNDSYRQKLAETIAQGILDYSRDAVLLEAGN